MKIIKPNIDRYQLLTFVSPLVGLLAAFIVFLIIVLVVGENPGDAIQAVLKFNFKNTAKVATLFSNAIPLFFAGIAVSFAFQAGIFNIGVEGQYLFGGFFGALAGIYLHLPPFIHIPVVILCSMIGGALWALIPALMKVKKGVHEVITTIMFNSIAPALLNFLVNGPFSGMGTESQEPQTKAIAATAIFHKLNPLFQHIGLKIPDYVYLDYSLIVAIVLGIVAWIFLFKTRFGFEIRAVGTSESVSYYSGIKVQRVRIAAFLLSGAVAGLIGLQEIFAIREFYTYSIASGLGFDGIAVSLIGNNAPVGIFFASILFSFLKQAGYGLQFYTSVPNSAIYVITGLMIIFIVVSNEIMKRYIKNLRKRENAHAAVLAAEDEKKRKEVMETEKEKQDSSS